MSALGLLLACSLNGATPPALPEPTALTQLPPRSSKGLKFPNPHLVGPAVPGLHQEAVPQGLAFLEKPGWLLISCYFDTTLPSMIAVVDLHTQKIVKTLSLLEADGRMHKGIDTAHVGGLAVSDKYLWVASRRVFRLPLEEILNAPAAGYVRLRDDFEAESYGSYIAVHNKVLWVGEFVLDESPRPKLAHHVKDRDGVSKYAWISGYALDDQENVIRLKTSTNSPVPPDYILSVRQQVQGLAMTDDHIFLSLSYGRENDSMIAVYRNEHPSTNATPHTTVKTRTGHMVPAWFLDGKNRVRQINFPPMSEGIAMCGTNLAVLSESGAMKYRRGGRAPLDSIILLDPLTAR